MATTTVTFPLDTVKTREQAILQHDPSLGELVEESTHVDTRRLFDGLTPQLVRNDMRMTVWFGNLLSIYFPSLVHFFVNQLVAAPANAAFFLTYDYLQALFVAGE